jgi:stress-induced morphogen
MLRTKPAESSLAELTAHSTAYESILRHRRHTAVNRKLMQLLAKFEALQISTLSTGVAMIRDRTSYYHEGLQAINR